MLFFRLQHLACLLISSQVMGQVKEAMVPFLFVKRREHQLEAAMKKAESFRTDEADPDIDYSVQKQANLESVMDEYEVLVLFSVRLCFILFKYCLLFTCSRPTGAT